MTKCQCRVLFRATVNITYRLSFPQSIVHNAFKFTNEKWKLIFLDVDSVLNCQLGCNSLLKVNAAKPKTDDTIDYIRILSIGLELACNRG